MAMAEMGERGRRLFDHSSCQKTREEERKREQREREGGRESGVDG